MALWLIRAGRNGEHEQRFLDESRVYVTWTGMKTDHDQRDEAQQDRPDVVQLEAERDELKQQITATVRSLRGAALDDAEEELKRLGVADAGYDSENNPRIAREDMGVRSIIPAGIGRPTTKLPGGRWRRHMVKRMKRKADQKVYGQRAQSEWFHSMIKRNQGPALCSRTPEQREKEMLLRVLTQNIMLLAAVEEEK